MFIKKLFIRSDTPNLRRKLELAEISALNIQIKELTEDSTKRIQELLRERSQVTKQVANLEVEVKKLREKNNSLRGSRDGWREEANRQARRAEQLTRKLEHGITRPW